MLQTNLLCDPCRTMWFRQPKQWPVAKMECGAKVKGGTKTVVLPSDLIYLCREEWGNPKNKEYYDYIKSYSPVDNIRCALFNTIH